MNVSVRSVCEDDATAIVGLLNPIIAAGVYTVMDAVITVQDQIDFIRGLPGRSVYLAALTADNAELVGIQDLQPAAPGTMALQHVGAISTFVSLDAQRVGVGEALMRETCQRAVGLGFRKLMATIRADNPEAQAYYQAQEFQVVGIAREHAFVGGRYIDEVLMERSVG